MQDDELATDLKAKAAAETTADAHPVESLLNDDANTKPNGTDKANADATPLQFTRFRSTKGQVGKSLYLDELGHLQKKSNVALADAQADVVTVYGLRDFAAYLAQCKPNDALSYGVMDRTSSHVVSKRRMSEHPGAITRTREFFNWRKGHAGIVLFDLDAAHIGNPPRTEQDAYERLCAAAPFLCDSPMLIIASSSSGIYNKETGALVTDPSWHVYVPVADAFDIPRFTEIVYERCWLVGDGGYVVSKSGRLLDRALIDKNVFWPEHLDFVGEAVCKPPLYRDAREPKIFSPTNPPLDTRCVSALSKHEQEIVSEARALSRHEMEPVAAVARRQWIDTYVQNEKERDPERDESDIRRTASAALYSGILGPEFLLYPEDGEPVCVETILSDPQFWHLCRFADPLDPNYRSDSRICTLYVNKGERPSMWSYAHGGQQYFLERPRQEICVKAGDTSQATTSAVDVLREIGALYDFGNDGLVRIINGEIIEVTAEKFRDFASNYIRFYKLSYSKTEKGWIKSNIDTPAELAKYLVDARSRERHFPKLTHVVTAPIMREDGSILDKPGYDAVSQLYFWGPPDLPAVPSQPTIADVLRALQLLWRPFIHFQMNDASRGVLLAALMTAVSRKSIPTAPAFGFDAPVFASGKTLLAACVAALAGVGPETHAPPSNDEEFEKEFFAALRVGATVYTIDNVVRPLDGEAFPKIARALTAPLFGSRILGLSKNQTVDNRCLMMVTGNNLSSRGDLVRRICVCRIEPRDETPEKRVFPFDPVAMIRRERQGLVRAVLIIQRGFQLHGRQALAELDDASTVGSYEIWDERVRQPIIWLSRVLGAAVSDDGLDGFADPMLTTAESNAADPDRDVLGRMLRAFECAFGERKLTAAQIIESVDSVGDIEDRFKALYDVIQAMNHANPTQMSLTPLWLGKWLAKRRGRYVENRCFERELDKHEKTWKWFIAFKV